MDLMKLSKNHTVEFNPIEKAKSILFSLNSFSKIEYAYLFGSAVNSVMTQNSDLDLLLVFKTKDILKTVQKEIFNQTRDIAVDWIFKIESDFDEMKNMGGVCFEAYHNGLKIK